MRLSRYSLHCVHNDIGRNDSQHLLSLQKILEEKFLYSNLYVEFCWCIGEIFLEKIWEWVSGPPLSVSYRSATPSALWAGWLGGCG
jgi:hypothetical protein